MSLFLIKKPSLIKNKLKLRIGKFKSSHPNEEPNKILVSIIFILFCLCLSKKNFKFYKAVYNQFKLVKCLR